MQQFFDDFLKKSRKLFRENHLFVSVVLLVFKSFKFICRKLLYLARDIFYPFINVFIYPILKRFYSRNLKKLSSETQVFFLTRGDFGSFLILLDYVGCWHRQRSPTSIVILTSWFPAAKKLAQNVCPYSIIICPDFVWLRMIVFIFGRIKVLLDTFSRLNAQLQAEWPAALFIYLQPTGLSTFHNYKGKSDYIRHLDPNTTHYKKNISSDFVNAYADLRKTLNYRLDVFVDWIRLHNQDKFVNHLQNVKELTEKLKSRLDIKGPYVVINIAAKKYYGDPLLNRREIHNPDRYNCIVDWLIENGYTVLLQGREEQPILPNRKGLVDYAHSNICSVENDLALYSGAAFCISSKSGPENFSTLCNVPLLGLEYVEFSSMSANPRFRFYPKHLLRKSTGKFLSFDELLTSPCYFDMASNYYDADVEYIPMNKEEFVIALEEFVPLASNPNTDWLNYTSRQKDFKEKLHPLHLDLFHVPGVPCDAYLQKRG